jgi:hypothetical protein
MNAEIQKYCERNGLAVLPDNEQWKNRFEKMQKNYKKHITN